MNYVLLYNPIPNPRYTKSDSKKIKPMLHQNILIHHIDDFFEPETFAILDAPKWKKSYTLRSIDYWGLCNHFKISIFFHIRFNIWT